MDRSQWAAVLYTAQGQVSRFAPCVETEKCFGRKEENNNRSDFHQCDPAVLHRSSNRGCGAGQRGQCSGICEQYAGAGSEAEGQRGRCLYPGDRGARASGGEGFLSGGG